MTVEDTTNRLTQYYSWLFSRQLEQWWPLLIVIAVLFIVVIVLFLRSRRKVLPTNAQLRDIIGIELADPITNDSQTDRIEEDRSAHVPKKRGRRKRRTKTKKGLEIAIKQPSEQNVYEIVPDNEPFQLKKAEQEQSETDPEESSEQDLKKKQGQSFDKAEFSKAAISRRQRLRSSIFDEYSDLEED